MIDQLICHCFYEYQNDRPVASKEQADVKKNAETKLVLAKMLNGNYIMGNIVC